MSSIKLLYRYVIVKNEKRRKKNVRMKNTHSVDYIKKNFYTGQGFMCTFRFMILTSGGQILIAFA